MRINEVQLIKNFFSASFLLTLWLILSGVYKPLVISFGVCSVVFVLFVVRRMDQEDGDGLVVELNGIQSMFYFFWLLKEIAKSNWSVTKLILSPSARIRPFAFSISCNQRTDIARVIFCNSITLTPGTITIDTEAESLIVHALAYSPCDKIGFKVMDRRVSTVESEY